MKDGLTKDERVAIARIAERQSQLAHVADTAMVRELLGNEIAKIRARAMARLALPGVDLSGAVAA